MDDSIDVGEASRLLTPPRCRQYDVGELGGLGEEEVLDDGEALVAGQDSADSGGLGHRDGGVGGRDPQEPDRPGFRVGHDLHRVGGRGPVRHRHRVDVPRISQLLDMFRVVPVAETRQVTVRAALAVVLSGRLPVHLQHSGAGTADHATQQMQIVHRHRGGCRLVRLIEPLQHRGQHTAALAEDLRCCAQVVGCNAADVGDVLGCVRVDCFAELVDADGVLAYPRVVHPVMDEQLAHEPVHQGQVGAHARSQMDTASTYRLLSDRGSPGVDTDDAGRVLATCAVEDPGPEHGLGLRHVVAVEEDRVAVLDVGVGARLPVGAERFLEGSRAGRGAQACVAVHVGGPEPGLPDHREGVVLLEEQLARGVEAVTQRTLLVQESLRHLDDAAHRGVPVGLDQFAVLPDEGPGETVRRGGPRGAAVQALRPKTPVTDGVTCSSTNPDHPAVLNRDVGAAPVAAQQTRGLHPTLHVALGDALLQMKVHAGRPYGSAWMRGAFAPDISDPINHGVVTFPCDSSAGMPTELTYMLTRMYALKQVAAE